MGGGYQKWKIQRNWEHRVHKTKDEDQQDKNITQLFTPIQSSNQNAVLI